MNEDKEIIQDLNILDRYEILTPIAADREVYLVMDRESGEIFVEKITKVYDPYLYQKMKHQTFPGVPAIKAFEEIEGKWIVVEDYVHGRNLSQHLQKEGVLAEEKVVSIMKDLCDILEPFHSMNPPVIHRDIKPENIILSKEGNVFLIDFNISREYKAVSRQDTVSMVSFHFSAPELYGFGQSDARSDIYSLGVTMYYLLTGNYPDRESDTGPLSEIIGTCTMIDPQDRYPSLAELKKALIEWEEDRVYEREMDAFPPGLRWLKRIERNLKPYMIPGFRTKHPLKMINAVVVYAMITALCLTMEMEPPLQGPVAGVGIWMEKFFTWLFMILTVFIIFDYRGWQRKIPLIGKIKLRFLRVILSILFLMMLTFCLIFTGLILLSVFEP